MDESGDSGMNPAPGDSLIGIQDLAALFGVTHRTLRFYEDQGLIEPQRAGSTRVYSRRDVARMQVILRGKRLGFSIREIREYLDLYDADPEHAEQTAALLDAARARLALLDQQRRALDETIEELDEIVRECEAHLTLLGRR